MPAAPRKPIRPRARPCLRWTQELAALPALSLRQPFAWLAANGIKDVENRSTRLVTLPKRVLLHASASRDNLWSDVFDDIAADTGCALPLDQEFDLGGIVGVATLVACVRQHASPWKESGSWGWVLADAAPLPYRECKGAVGFFYPKFSDLVERKP